MWQNAQFSFHLIRYCSFIVCMIKRWEGNGRKKLEQHEDDNNDEWKRTRERTNERTYKYHIRMRWGFSILSEILVSHCPLSHSFDSAYWRIWNVWAYGFIWFSYSLCHTIHSISVYRSLWAYCIRFPLSVPILICHKIEVNAHEVYRHVSFLVVVFFYVVRIAYKFIQFNRIFIVVASDLVLVYVWVCDMFACESLCSHAFSSCVTEIIFIRNNCHHLAF